MPFETDLAEQPLLVRLLIEREVMSTEDLSELMKVKSEHSEERLEAQLVIGELAHEEDIAQAFSQYLGVPWVGRMVDEEADTAFAVQHDREDEVEPIGTTEEIVDRARKVADRISETVCRRHRVIPVGCTTQKVVLGCLDPTNFAAVEEVRMRSGAVVQCVALTMSLLDELIAAFFGERDIVREIADEGSRRQVSGAADDEEDEDMEFVLDLHRPIPSGKDSQVVRIVNVILTRAIEEGASDIHIEPYEDTVRVRYRVDGRLIETTPPPRSLFIAVISRLKILSKMDIAEKRVPQDGAIALRSAEKRVDLRVSSVPTVYGEKIVIRILEKEGIPDRLEKLGFSDDQAHAFLEAAHSPHGLMFVTGPTGSGKSTTLYCCLNLINQPTENIVTVEDPVEYKFTGLNQVHVRSNVGLTFATALRAFLRQDPDKIMVGEVRDQETADICMRAALTGHLVLSTLHTNTALQVINRLVDMGIEPFLLGPALRMLEAQRLVRRLCDECKEPYDVPEEVAVVYGIEPGTTLYRPGADPECPKCHGAGNKGRLGIYEVITINEELREMISSRAPVAQIEKAARASGMQFLDDAARNRLTAGLASLEEVAEYVKVPT